MECHNLFDTWYITVYTASWVIICYRSHPLKEPDKSIDDIEIPWRSPLLLLDAEVEIHFYHKATVEPNSFRCFYGFVFEG